MAIEKEWIFAKCLAQTGAKHDFQADWQADRFLIDTKMFAMLGTDAKGVEILTVKAEPSMGELLRQQYADIIPGYYMNKLHWNSIYLESEVPLDLVEQLIAGSHRLILNGLSKKRQKEILEQSHS